MEAKFEGISVVIPAFNEEEYVGNVLARLLGVLNNSKTDFEVIVVDNGSTDQTIEIIKSFQVKLLVCETKGAAACRNYGAERAKYNIIAFIDSDCLVSEGWVENIKNNLAKDNVGAYGGPYLAPKQGTWVEKAWAPTRISSHSTSLSLLAGGNFTVKRNVFIKLNGFREDLLTAEDDDLSRRIKSAGYDCIKDTNQPVVHLGYPKTMKESFFKVLWHGKTQLRANGLFADKMVMLTYSWMFVVLSCLYSINNTPLFFTLMICVLFILPGVLVAKKLSDRTVSFYEILINYFLALITLIARSLGLILELSDIIKSKLMFNKEKSL